MKTPFAPHNSANHLATPSQEREAVRTPLDTLTTDVSDVMLTINEQNSQAIEVLDALTNQTMKALDDLALTQSVLQEITLSGDDVALTNKVVAREITELRTLQERYNALALDGANSAADGNTAGAQLVSLQAAIDSQVNTITINTPQGEQAIDFSVLDDEQPNAPKETAVPEGVDVTETSAVQAVDAPVKATNVPTFSTLAAEYGIDESEFGDVSDIIGAENSFGTVDDILGESHEQPHNTVDVTTDEAAESFGDVSDIIGDKEPESFGDVNDIIDDNDSFGDVDDIIDAEPAQEVVAAQPEVQSQTPEKPSTSRVQRLKNYLFAASLGVAQLPQKIVKARHDHQVRESLKSPDEKERRDRRVGIGVVLGGAALLGAGLIARHYGLLDGNETVPDVRVPEYPYDLDHNTPSFTAPEAGTSGSTPDVVTPDVVTPDTPPTPDSDGGNAAPAPEIDTADYSQAFTVRFGGGGEELMKQLGVSTEKWYDLAPELLEKFPRDFYAKTDDGSIAGIMRPGELPENVQEFLIKKLGLS